MSAEEAPPGVGRRLDADVIIDVTSLSAAASSTRRASTSSVVVLVNGLYNDDDDAAAAAAAATAAADCLVEYAATFWLPGTPDEYA